MNVQAKEEGFAKQGKFLPYDFTKYMSAFSEGYVNWKSHQPIK